MKKVKKIVKKLIIVYVICYILLGSIGTTSYATLQNYSRECGEYLANYAREFIATYGADSNYGGASKILYHAESTVAWGAVGVNGSFGEGTFWSCCTSGVWYMYQQALGINIYDMGYSASSGSNLNLNNDYFEWISVSEAQPGDILVKSGHVEMALTDGATEHANFGHYSEGDNCNVHSGSDSFTGALRLKSSVEVDPSGTVESASAGTGSTSTSNDMSNFYFNGIPDGEYSIASTNLLSAIIDTLAQVADYIIGILTFGPRVVIVGWTALVDQLVTSFVNSLVGNGEVDESGISSVEIDSASSSDRVTIENLVYNLYAPLDINIFK